MVDFTFGTPFDLGHSPMQIALERRLRARAARADSAVELTPQLLHQWMREEMATIREEYEAAYRRARILQEN